MSRMIFSSMVRSWMSLALLSVLQLLCTKFGTGDVLTDHFAKTSREVQIASNVVFVEPVSELAIAAANQDAAGLQVAEGPATADATNSVLVQTVSNAAQSGYVDFVSGTAGSLAPAPTPTASSEPTPPPPRASMPTATSPSTTLPASAPTPSSSTATAAVPVFIETIAGAPVLSDNADVMAITVADNVAATDTTKSVKFASVANGDAEYNIFLSAPALPTGAMAFEITLGVQLEAGANGAHWKVDMYEHIGKDDWTVAGDLSAVATGASWTTVKISLVATTLSNFIEATSQEILVRVYTSGATGVEGLYLDYISVVATASAVQATCGAAYTCPAGFTLDAAAPCIDACDNKECCSQLTCGNTYTCPSSFVLNPAAPCVDTCDNAECCTEVTPTEVFVDMQPCILASQTIAKDVGQVADAYLISNFFKGFWTASQNIQAPPGDVLDLTIDVNHGRCNVIFVGIVPSAAQKTQLRNYSRRFKVRLVYFDVADTANDGEVVTRLGFQQHFLVPILGAPRIKLTAAGHSTNSIVPAGMISSPKEFNIFTRPMVRFSSGDGTGAATAVAEYADESGIGVTSAANNPSAAIVTWAGNDSLEEMHVFFSLAWFDMASWAWAHYITEWATKGVFQGERRFYLGAVVDDLFLSTGVFDFNAPNQQGPDERLTGAQLSAMAEAQDRMNAKHKAEVFTDYAFNGYGILKKVGSAYLVSSSSGSGLLPKGEKPNPPEGIAPQLPVNWLSTAVPGMTAEFPTWRAKDDLLDTTLSILDKFHWQSHSYSHLVRDNLGVSDCSIEDSGNAQIAVLTGMFGSDNYNWRSMTTPGISGLFNKNCLESGAANLMKCYPGDNTYDGVQTSVSLVSLKSPYYGVFTTEATNGYKGAQIIPRFATNVYYNCVTTDCLIQENEKIRRDVCGCVPLDPNQPITSCSGCAVNNIGSFRNIEALFKTEQITTTRYILSGRRDKYMFHQANVIPTATPKGTKSLLEYWYEVVLEQLAAFINTDTFPIKTLKFDDLCQNFAEHEYLDNSNSLVTSTVAYATGAITGMTIATTAEAGLIPITVPTASAASISLGTLVPYKTEVYGADTTYYFTTSESAKPIPFTKPAVSELAPVP